MFLMAGGAFEKYVNRYNKYIDTYLGSLPLYEKKLYIENSVSLLHSIFISAEGVLCLLDSSRNPRRHLHLMSGYFLLDTLIQGKVKSLTTIHHVAGLVLIYFSSLSKERYIFKLLPYFMLSEISTIFLCFGTMINGIRWHPIKNKSKKMLLAKNITFNAFALTFFLTRIVLLPYKVHEMYKHHSDDLKEFGGVYSEIAVFSLLFLQVYWYRLIFKIVIRNLEEQLVQMR